MTGIVVAPDLFGPDHRDPAPEMGDEDASVLIESPQIEQATLALRYASSRMQRVDQHGREYADVAAVDAAGELEMDIYFPSYMSGIDLTPVGPTLVMDVKYALRPHAAATMVQILREELERAGVTTAVIRQLPWELAEQYLLGTDDSLSAL